MGRTRIAHFSGSGGSFELAVTPKQLSVSQSSQNKSIDLLNVGEVVMAGNRSPIKLSVETFLPTAKSPFYKGKSPEEITMLIKKWKNSKQAMRVIITGTDINLMCLIESTSETYTEGQTDIQVKWDLVEYRVLNKEAIASTSFVGFKEDNELQTRGDNLQIPKTIIIKNGDTLYGYAKRFYGDGGLLYRIADANGILNPKNIKMGDRIKIPGKYEI